MAIKRINSGSGHRYVNTDTGARVPGVTTLTGKGVPKPALINWSANATIDYAIDHWAELSKLPISERIKRLSRGRYESRDEAGRKGTVVHKLAERLILGEKVPIPEGLEGYVNSYVKFLDEFNVQAVLVEAVIVSYEYNYCGTLDVVADLVDPDTGDMLRWLYDIKTSRSGIFGDVSLQLAPYRFCDFYIDENGEEQPMLAVEQTGAVWVRQDGYELKPVIAEERQHMVFLSAIELANFIEDSRDLVGDAIAPPRASMFRLERQ